MSRRAPIQASPEAHAELQRRATAAGVTIRAALDQALGVAPAVVHRRTMTDPHAAYEGRTHMREVTEEAFRAYRRRYPDADWCIKTPIGEPGPQRFFVPVEDSVNGMNR